LRQSLTVRCTYCSTATDRWILTHVPIIEDGNNFGVGVQQEVAKLLRESVEKLEKAFDTLPEYHEKRAAAWEKLAAKSEKTSKKTESKNSSKGGKDGDESKQSTSEESSESTSQSVQSPDGLKALLALDVRCYVSLHRTAQLSRDLVLFCTDMVEQNVSKIVAPKGEAHRGGAPGFMF
jgi:Proteasome activator pa28 beta subunit